MLKKMLTAALCTAVLAQNMAILHADEEVTVFPEDELTSAEQIPSSYDTDDLIVDDEGSDAYGIDVEYHSIGKIREFYEAHKVNFLDSSYSVNPNTTTPPYAAGQLTDATLNDALKAVNLIRYIAGLNYDVTLDSDYTEMTQAGSLLHAINKELSHTPTKPAGINNELYQLGYQGSSKSDIAEGYSSIANAITESWLNDGNANSISTLRNRRWLLNAGMSKTGFGQVGQYSSMYTYDTDSTCTRNSNVWPAQNTPLEFFGSNYPWSISTGHQENINNIKVTMTNKETQQMYEFTAASASGYFTVDNSSYGTPGAVIWRPENLTYADGDTYEITITGLSTGTAYYNVTFFQLDLSNERVVMNPASVNLDVGGTAKIYYSIDPSTSTDTFARRTYYANGVIRIDHLYSSRFEITALKPGNTYVKVVTTNGLEGICPITVNGLRISNDSITLNKSEQKQLTANIYPENPNQVYTWTSSNSAVASVDATGLVTGNKAGTATITASAGGYTASATVTVEAIDLKAVNLTLTGNIGVNFSFDIPASELNDTYVSFTLNGNTNRYSAADAEADENGWLRFSALAAAKEMRDTITVRVENEAGDLKQFESSGSTIEGTFDYSVEKYFKSARKNYADDTKLMNLINAMDTYGKYAQIKFDHVTDGMGTPDTLGTVNLTDLNQFKPADTGSVTGITVSNISLALETDTVVKPYFTVAAGHNINEYVIKADNAAVELIDAGSANTYYAQLKGVAAADLDQPINMVITNKTGTETESITYYPLSYVRSVLKNSASYEADLVDVCKALYFYWVNAEAYFSN